MSQISLPEQTAEKLQAVATKQGVDATALLVHLVEEYLAEQSPAQLGVEALERTAQAKKIAREQQQYEAQHTALLGAFAGEYIAMHEGQIVDHDADRVALSRRIRSRYGRTAILIIRVGDTPQMRIVMRSPPRRRVST
jgi:predicted DNA-binding protein